jgi:acetoin utilization deacetylase AcuC-like enzyme
MQAYYAAQFVLPLPPGHRFPMSKYERLHQRVLSDCPGIRLAEAPPASDGELALVHTPRYIDAVSEGHLSAAEQREIGFPWSPRMVERARRSVGATIAAARTALFEGQHVAANLAGGTHHAQADKGSGYCVFNDVAVAARLMQAEWHRRGPHVGGPHGRTAGLAQPTRGDRRLLRIAVIDLDVHQGNGTAAIFRDDDTVFTLSLHGAKNFPLRKEPSDLDVELPDGCSDDAYLDALDAALAALWRHHGEAPPGLVFYVAGADAHEGDRLGRLALSASGLAERDRRVFSACRERSIAVAVSMAGGYGRCIDDSVAVHLRTLQEAFASWRDIQGRVESEIRTFSHSEAPT